MGYSKFRGNDLNHNQYQDFKDKVLNNSIVRKVVSYKELTLISDSIIEYKDVKFLMTEQAFKNLIKILGLSITVVDEISKKLGETVLQKLMTALKVAMSNAPGTNQVCLIVDRQTQKIVGFSKAAQSTLSNNAFFTLFEQTMNNHSGMHIKNMGITDNGNIEISVLNENWEFNIGGLNEEFFKSGLVFINTPTSTIINPYNERLTCTNGMVTSIEGHSIVLKNSDKTSVNGFFDVVRNLKGVQNFEQEFRQRITKMMNTQASYSELLKVRHSCEYEISNIKFPDVRLELERFIPTQEVKEAFMNQKIDLDTLDNKQHQKIRTMLNVWELVNRLTDLSSHADKYGFILNNGDSSVFQLQRVAGDLSFKKQYDLECVVKQEF